MKKYKKTDLVKSPKSQSWNACKYESFLWSSSCSWSLTNIPWYLNSLSFSVWNNIQSVSILRF